MAQDLTVADSQPVVELLQGYRRSKAMFAGVQLGVFDALEKGAQTSEQLSHSLNCNSEALERLLCALVGLQLLARRPDGFCNTATSSTYLTSTSPRRLTGYINYSNAVGWQLWGQLENAIREGSNRWKQCFGWDEPIFSSFFKTEDAANEFLMGMHGFGRVSSPAVVNALDLSRFKHLVDLGGATGHLAIAACERYSTLQATVFDLPAARPLAEKIIAESQVGERVRVVSGDFFTDELPQADLFALGRIIHDWSEPKVLLLLRKIYAQLPQQGALLICEKVLWDDKSGPGWAIMQNLNMLACTEGKERTLSEYADLLEQVGFGQVSCCRTVTPIDGILAIKGV